MRMIEVPIIIGPWVGGGPRLSWGTWITHGEGKIITGKISKGIKKRKWIKEDEEEYGR